MGPTGKAAAVAAAGQIPLQTTSPQTAVKATALKGSKQEGKGKGSMPGSITSLVQSRRLRWQQAQSSALARSQTLEI